MLLLHTVLAVVCGGLLVSAHPEPVQGRRWDAEDTEFTDANVPSYHVKHQAPADDAWEWDPQGPQHIFGTPPHHTEGLLRPNAVRENWPEAPHSFPDPPQNHPEPPQFPPQFPSEPHYPPPPGPPPPHPPKEGPPHHPHPPHSPPHLPKPDPGTKDQTVYQFLESHPRFSRLFKLVNYTEDVTSYLNDSSQSVTFFALPDFGFPKPPHRPNLDEDPELEDLFQMPEGSLGDMLAAAEGYLNRARKPDESRVKAFIKYVLLYNILPENTPLHELGKNNTFATALKLPDGSLDGKALRVRVKRNIGLDPRPFVNFISKVLVPDIPVKNGIIHVVSKPILPPPSIFQIGFLFPDAFSTFTSALQRVGLTDELDFSNNEDGSTQGSPAVSVFAPTNKAFSRLPPKLKLFLFSPFGKKALKKLLQFHIVPEAVLHSDYFHNASQSEFALPWDNSADASEFYAQLDHRPEAWSAIFKELTHGDWGGLKDEDAYESSEWREENLNSGNLPSWENHHHHAHGPSFLPHSGPFPHEGPHAAPHFPYPGDAHPPRHHGPFPRPPPPPPHDGLHHPPHYPPPPPSPEVWLHYPPPPSPPHHLHDGPHHPPHYPPPPPPSDVWVHYPPPPPPPHGPHHPPHFPPPPPPPFEGPPHQPPHHPPPPPGPHAPPRFPPPPGKLPKDGRPHHRLEVVYSVNATVPTLLENSPLDVKIVQVAFKGPHHKPSFYHTFVIAHGQHVAVADIAARNGAVHVITKLLNPLKKPGHHHGHDEEGDEPNTFKPFAEEEEDEWANWEEWLPLWAEEDD